MKVRNCSGAIWICGFWPAEAVEPFVINKGPEPLNQMYIYWDNWCWLVEVLRKSFD